MNKQSTLKLNSKGTIVSFSSSDAAFLAALSPKQGYNFFEQVGNDQSKKTLLTHIQPLFSSGEAIDFTINISGKLFSVTAIGLANEEVVTSWKVLRKENREKQKKLSIEPLVLSTLSDLAFQNSISPKTLFLIDGSIIDFNKAASDLLGYTQEEYGYLSVFDLSIRHTPQSWKERWQMLKDQKQQTVYSKL